MNIDALDNVSKTVPLMYPEIQDAIGGELQMIVLRRSLFYMVWTIGFIALEMLCHHVLAGLQKQASETYQMNHLAVAGLLLNFAIGVYIGIILIRDWHFRVNLPLLVFAFLPTLIVNVSVVSLFHLRVPLWLLNLNPTIVSMLSGIILLRSLFGTSKPQSGVAGVYTVGKS